MKMTHRSGAVVTAGLLLLWTALLVGFFSPHFILDVVVYLFSGKVFSDNRVITGGALDQPSLHKGYFLFSLSSLLIIPCVLAVRWISDWQQKRVRVVFRIFSLVLFLLPLSLLTITFYQLLRYINAMGFTPMRLAGVALGLAGYATMIGCLYWVWRVSAPINPAYE